MFSQQNSKFVSSKLNLNQKIQPKLTINNPGDVYEQEADAMAEKVMRMPINTLENKSITGIIGASIQRKCASCEEEEKRKPIMRKEVGVFGGKPVSNSFSSSLNATKGGGSSLPQGIRSFMENAFSTDFSGVRIHADSNSNKISQSINAKAFTHGNDIYFGAGQYNPNSYSGKSLLAHELTHTVQQGNKTKQNKVQRLIGDGHDLSSPRFRNEPTLEEIYDGSTTLAIGSTGEAVRKIQHALQDFGVFLRHFGIDGIYEQETRRGVATYQRRKNITSDPSGSVGVETITALNSDFPAVTDSATTLSQNPADMACLLELLCPWNRALVTDFRNATFRVILVDRLFWADEQFDGATWQPNPMEGAGETDNGIIRIRTADSCDSVAKTLYHEYQHARSPRRLRSQPWADEETNAYTIETEWSIARGISPDPSLVTTDPNSGATVVNTTGVSSQVSTYPGMVTGSNEEVIAKVGATRVRVRRENGTVYVRAAIAGDSVPGGRQVVNPRSIRARDWVCS